MNHAKFGSLTHKEETVQGLSVQTLLLLRQSITELNVPVSKLTLSTKLYYRLIGDKEFVLYLDTHVEGKIGLFGMEIVEDRTLPADHGFFTDYYGNTKKFQST